MLPKHLESMEQGGCVLDVGEADAHNRGVVPEHHKSPGKIYDDDPV